MTIVENHLLTVTGGIDTHLDFHVAAAIDSNGGVLGVETFDTTTGGYRCLVAWLAGFGTISLIGVEGTGSYGAGVTRHLTDKGIRVVEVDRPNRQARHRAGKTDAIDAIAAARAALTGTATGVPKSRTGNIEAIRVLTVARRSAANEWIAVVNQIRHVTFTAPDEIRARFIGLSPITLVRTTAALKPRGTDPDVVRFTTLSTLRELGRRALFLRAQKMRLNTQMRPLIREVAPSLLEVHGRRVRRRREAADRSRRQPAPHQIRSRVGTPLRGRADPRHHQARSNANATASTAAATAKQTRRPTGSCSPAWPATNAPRTTSRNAPPKARPSARSHAS
jgi:hypothetical protein